MNAYQRDLGFLLLVKHGTNPFTYNEIGDTRDELLTREAKTHTEAELEWLILSKHLYVDRLLQDNIVEVIDVSVSNKAFRYKLTDEFIEELKNEK